MKTRRAWLTLVLFAVSGLSAFAMPPLSRQAVGKVVAIQPENERFTWRATETGRELQLTWNRRSTFFLHGQETSAAALQPGQSVRVSFRTPLFGPPSTSRVVILMPPTLGQK